MPKPLPRKAWVLPALPTADPGLKRRKALKALANGATRRRIGLDKHVYARIQQHRTREWAEIVAAFESHPDFHNAYRWLQHHPLFHRFRTHGDPTTSPIPVRHEKHLVNDQGLDLVDVDVVRVNPQTRRIDRDPALNTATHVWLEAGPVLWDTDRGTPTHDTDLDCGATTYEKAIIKMARLVHRRYGNDRQVVDSASDRSGQPTPACKPVMSVPKAIR